MAKRDKRAAARRKGNEQPRNEQTDQPRFDVRQAWAARRKTITAAIRLRHSLAADAEIAAALRVEKEKFDRAVLQGYAPAPLALSR
jgi:hypothetical protein